MNCCALQALVLELESDKCETIALPPQSEHCMVNPTTDKSMSPFLAVKGKFGNEDLCIVRYSDSVSVFKPNSSCIITSVFVC